MNLVIFDIDGTLTQTMDVDTECFVQTVRDVLGMDPTGMSWDDFPHVTDQGVLGVLYRQSRGRLPNDSETEAFITHFVDLMEGALRRDLSSFAEVPGAGAMVAHLAKLPGWTMAMATGAWRQTARMKLDAAQIPDEGIPLATSDDHYTREGIIETALARARVATGRNAFDRIVSIGDGAWDVRTARNLGLPFVGVGTQEDLARIQAPVGLENFFDVTGVMELLETAPVP